MKKYKIAVLDDYQNVALESADWSLLRERADIAVLQNHLADPDGVTERLLPFDVVCVMRERTRLPHNVIERLPDLKLIASTGPVNASIDVGAAGDHGIVVVHTGYWSDPTIEFTWALISEHPMRSRRSRDFSPVTIAATLRERNCSSTAVSRKSNLYETSK
jgi:lactate dehydrogenase-like 2-hydroxyacid dehydrogenase